MCAHFLVRFYTGRDCGMNRKLRVGVLFGGKSTEHEVSLCSARNVIEALDRQKYDVFLIGIDKMGQWRLRDAYSYLMYADQPHLIQLQEAKESLAFVSKQHCKELVSYSENQLKQSLGLDVIFPVLHGMHGEDGTVQGLLKLANIPFVGAGVLGSAIGMDKDVMKRLLRDAQIPVARFITVYEHEKRECHFEAVVEQVGCPFFVKPANSGSSVGVFKVKSKEEFTSCMEGAFLCDRKILIEEFIQGREIECSILGNEHPLVSLPGEVIPQHEFYSYEAKYLDAEGARFEIPALLSSDLIEKIQQMAKKTYLILCCEGMARIDFFLREDGVLYVNEINTIPGFTAISMYPKLWEASGVPLPKLLDTLIELALQRHHKESSLKF
jgi:D-alanine-D-alanine ligase